MASGTKKKNVGAPGKLTSSPGLMYGQLSVGWLALGLAFVLNFAMHSVAAAWCVRQFILQAGEMVTSFLGVRTGPCRPRVVSSSKSIVCCTLLTHDALRGAVQNRTFQAPFEDGSQLWRCVALLPFPIGLLS